MTGPQFPFKKFIVKKKTDLPLSEDYLWQRLYRYSDLPIILESYNNMSNPDSEISKFLGSASRIYQQKINDALRKYTHYSNDLDYVEISAALGNESQYLIV